MLVEGDNINEPVSDAARGLLDGHLVLSRQQAAAGNYPAIDLLSSVSRVAQQIADREHLAAIAEVRRLLGAYREHEDLISVGAYRPGSNPLVDRAVDTREAILRYACQTVDQRHSPDATRRALLDLVRSGTRAMEAAA